MFSLRHDGCIHTHSWGCSCATTTATAAAAAAVAGYRGRFQFELAPDPYAETLSTARREHVNECNEALFRFGQTWTAPVLAAALVRPEVSSGPPHRV